MNYETKPSGKIVHAVHLSSDDVDTAVRYWLLHDKKVAVPADTEIEYDWDYGSGDADAKWETYA